MAQIDCGRQYFSATLQSSASRVAYNCAYSYAYNYRSYSLCNLKFLLIIFFSFILYSIRSLDCHYSYPRNTITGDHVCACALYTKCPIRAQERQRQSTNYRLSILEQYSSDTSEIVLVGFIYIADSYEQRRAQVTNEHTVSGNVYLGESRVSRKSEKIAEYG